MTQDLNIHLPSGRLNIRAGAIIVKGGSVLLIWSNEVKHWYTVGGRIHFGESSYEAVLREIREELGEFADSLKGGTLIATEENFFAIGGKPVHEFGYYYIFDGSALPSAEEIPLHDCDGFLKFLTIEEIKRERVYPLFLKDGIPNAYMHIIKRDEVTA